jgi:hypothetical protein
MGVQVNPAETPTIVPWTPHKGLPVDSQSSKCGVLGLDWDWTGTGLGVDWESPHFTIVVYVDYTGSPLGVPQEFRGRPLGVLVNLGVHWESLVGGPGDCSGTFYWVHLESLLSSLGLPLYLI